MSLVNATGSAVQVLPSKRKTPPASLDESDSPAKSARSDVSETQPAVPAGYATPNALVRNLTVTMSGLVREVCEVAVALQAAAGAGAGAGITSGRLYEAVMSQYRVHVSIGLRSKAEEEEAEAEEEKEKEKEKGKGKGPGKGPRKKGRSKRDVRRYFEEEVHVGEGPWCMVKCGEAKLNNWRPCSKRAWKAGTDICTFHAKKETEKGQRLTRWEESEWPQYHRRRAEVLGLPQPDKVAAWKELSKEPQSEPEPRSERQSEAEPEAEEELRESLPPTEAPQEPEEEEEVEEEEVDDGGVIATPRGEDEFEDEFEDEDELLQKLLKKWPVSV